MMTEYLGIIDKLEWSCQLEGCVKEQRLSDRFLELRHIAKEGISVGELRQSALITHDALFK